MSVTRMTSKTIGGLFLFAASIVVMLALASQQGRKPFSPAPSRYSSQDVRLLSAEEINRRTLALAAKINVSAK